MPANTGNIAKKTRGMIVNTRARKASGSFDDRFEQDAHRPRRLRRSRLRASARSSALSCGIARVVPQADGNAGPRIPSVCGIRRRRRGDDKIDDARNQVEPNGRQVSGAPSLKIVDGQAARTQQAAKGGGNAAVVSGQLVPRIAGQLRHRGIGRHRPLPARGAERSLERRSAIEATAGVGCASSVAAFCAIALCGATVSGDRAR